MSKASFLRRVGRSVKDMLQGGEHASLSKRISFAQQQAVRRDKKKSRDARKADYVLMSKKTGLNESEIKERFERFRDMGIAELNHAWFKTTGLYMLDDEMARRKLRLIRKSIELEEDLIYSYHLPKEKSCGFF